MERGRHSVDLPISRTLVALRRVRSLRDPTTNSMSRFSTFTNHLDWETQSCNAGWSGAGNESHFDEGDGECRFRTVEALFEGDERLRGRRSSDGAHQVGTSTTARISRNGSLRRQVDAESNASMSSHEGRCDDKVLVQESRLKYHKELDGRSKMLEPKELKEILYSNNDAGSSSTILRSNLGSPCYSLDQEICHSPSLSALDNYPSDPRRLERNKMVKGLDGLAEDVKHVSSQCSPLSECQSNGFEQRKVRMDCSKYVKPWVHNEEDFECEDELACCCSARTMRFGNRFFPHLCRCGLPSSQVRCSRKSCKLYRSNNINFHKASMSETSSPSVPLLRSGGEDIRRLRAECINGCFCSHENLAFEDADDHCSVQHSESTRLGLASTYQNQEVSLRSDEDAKSLSQKFRPKSFDDLVGQSLVVQSLKNAVLRGKIAPFYLFQGPHGTGKTSTARVFSTALNCLSAEDLRPCGFCLECIAFLSGQSADIKEIDFGRAKHMYMFKSLLKHAAIHSPATSRYRIFILNECHLLQGELWASLLKCIEKLPRYVVFIFITADPDRLPRAALSRCQRYHFSKIKPKEIVSRLCRLCVQENMDFDKAALEYVAGKSNGSLQDAEAMLEQLALLGQTITVPLVLELTGVISDDELFDLLDMALSADTCNTVRRAREIMRSRVDPMALVSQLANLVMDILGGWRQWRISGISRKFFKSHSLTEVELQKLRHSLKILSEAEKQLRMSKNQTTWLTVALLQFGNMEPSLPLNPDHQWASQGSPELREDNFSCASFPQFPVDISRNSVVHVMDIHEPYWLESQNDKSGKLDSIWRKTLANLQSRTLKDFLEREGQLSSLCIDKGLGIAELQFRHPQQVLRAEKSQKHIKNSLRGVLGCDMEVRINLIPVSYPESSVEVQQSYQSKPANKGPCANENCLNSPLSHHQTATGRRKHKSRLSEVNVCHFFPCMRKPDSKSTQEVALHSKPTYSPDNLSRNAPGEDAAKYQKIANGDAESVCVLENVCLKQVKHRDFQYQALATPKIHKSCFPVVIRLRRRLHASDNVQTVDLKTNVHEELEHSDPREASFKAYICTDDSCVPSSNPCSQPTKFSNQDKSSKCSRTMFKFHCWRAPKFRIKKMWKKRRQRQWKSRLIRWVLHCTAQE